MIIEGHDVETASQVVDAMQSSRVGAAYLPPRFEPETVLRTDTLDAGFEWP